jgi:excisionase family DNA binding protein
MSTVAEHLVTTPAAGIDLSGVEEFLAHAQSLRLASADGSEVALPSVLADVLKAAVGPMSRGQSVSVAPVDDEMTTQQAADFLGYSRPTVVRLLDEGRIPSVRLNSHRRVHLADVIAFRDQLAVERRAALAEMSRDATAHGLRADGFVTTR